MVPEPVHTGVDIDALTAELDARLAGADRDLASAYPGERPGRQPVHTVYVPAHRYTPDLVDVWGAEARDAMAANADAFASLTADPVGPVGPVGPVDPVDPAHLVHLVREKLAREPIEDLRIDFEDGFGAHPDHVEDAAVTAAASALNASIDAGTAPPFMGIRFKSFEAPTRARGIRTLSLFLAAVSRDGTLPDGFVVTLPKVTSVEQVEAMVIACERLESGLGIDRPVDFEIQIETPQSILGPDGTALVARMIQAARGRCTGLHYGTYDYSASAGIAAQYQSMEHPAADHAKAVMQVAAAGTGVRLSDGSTNLIPVGDSGAIERAWALHHRLVLRSLERGYYQGWDLHPAQLPTRYAAVFSFYRKGFDTTAARLRAYSERSASGFMDEPATARALAGFLLRGLEAGALGPEEVRAATAMDRSTLESLAGRARR